jgi:hypothetical protein
VPRYIITPGSFYGQRQVMLGGSSNGYRSASVALATTTACPPVAHSGGFTTVSHPNSTSTFPPVVDWIAAQVVAHSVIFVGFCGAS